jgi:hypothetical protein
MGARNRVGIGLSYRPTRLHRLATRYDNSVPTQLLSPIDCFTILAPGNRLCGTNVQYEIIVVPPLEQCSKNLTFGYSLLFYVSLKRIITDTFSYSLIQLLLNYGRNGVLTIQS